MKKYKFKVIAGAGLITALLFLLLMFSHIFQLSEIFNPFIIPFVLYAYAQKYQQGIWGPAVGISCLSFLISNYQIFFIISYIIIALGLIYIKTKWFILDIWLLSIIYAFFYFGAYLIVSFFMFGYKFEDWIFIFTGMKGRNFHLALALIITEPIIYSWILISSKTFLQKLKI